MSDTDNIDRVEQIFDLARRIEAPDVRASYVSQACNGDAALQSRINELLEIHLTGDGLLDRPPVDVGPTALIPNRDLEREGESIGHFQLLQKLGEGGFGVVYMAEQMQPIRRKVALKIIKPGMESDDVIARFEAERQALAMMNHTNIAAVLDGGCTPSGRPYFVMELVRGVSITEYCDKKNLPSADRVRLFMDVCSAIQHAHQKGIIHRDLKPSNVMVTLHDGRPVVKVIDFGVAKAINQQLTEKMFFTRYGQMIGTPQYMSPEQAEMSGLGIDTLSDVYSLGVLLYELLVGMTPLSEVELREAGYKELQRMICEEEAARPSNRLSTTGRDQLIDIATHRGVTPEQLADDVSGDLEWIVMKTLEKERERRYSTPLELSRDLQRYLDDQPVEARPPTLAYRFSKYVRRHRGLVSAIAAIGFVLIGSTVFSSIMWRAARHQEKIAWTRAEELGTQQKITAGALDESRRLSNELEGQLYHVRIDEASELIQKSQPSEARNVLAKCPEGLRDWEFKRLNHVVTSTRGDIQGAQVPMFGDSSDRVLCISSSGGTGKCTVWNLDTGEQLEQKVLTILDDLTMAAFHFDGRRLATASKSGELSLVEIAEGVDLAEALRKSVLRHRIDNAHSDRVDGLEYSPDGSTLASASWDGWLRLWDADAGKMLAEQNTGRPLRSVAFDVNGRYVATAVAEVSETPSVVRICDSRTLEVIKDLETDGQMFRCVCFSQDGKSIVAAGSTCVAIWDVETWTMQKQLPTGSGQVQCVRFNSDGSVLAVTGKEFVQFWSVPENRLLKQITLPATTIWWGAFSPDDQTFAYYQGENVIGVYDLKQNGLRGRGQVISLAGRNDRVYGGAFSVDGKQFAAAGDNRSINVWDTTTLEGIRISHGHQTQIMELDWDKQGRLVSRDNSGSVQVWDQQGKPLWNRSDKTGYRVFYPFDLMSIDQVRGQLLLGTYDQGILRLDMKSGEQSAAVKTSGPVRALACSPDGRWLAWCDNEIGTLQFWDLREEQRVHSISTNLGNIRKIQFAPDGNRLAAISALKVVEFDVSSKQRLWWKEFPVQLWGCAYSSDGKRLFVSPGTKDEYLKVFDTRDGSLVYQVFKPKCAYVEFDPVRECLACFGLSKEIRLYETKVLDAEEGTGYPPLSIQEWTKATPFDQYLECRDILFQNQTEQFSRALELATAATATMPQCAEYELIRGVSLYRGDQIDECIDVLERVDSMTWNEMNWGEIQRDTLDTYSHAIRAMAYHRKGFEELAHKHLETASQLAGRSEHSAVVDVLAEAKVLLADE